MKTAKIAISIDKETLMKLDRLVGSKVFPNRSRAIQEAVKEKINRIEKNRLAQECSKLDTQYEQEFSEEGFDMEINEWPEY